MKRYGILLLFIAAIAMSTHSALAQNKANGGFDKLKSLAGEWQGKKSDGSAVTVSYQVVSGGNSVMEMIEPGAEPSMVTIYHTNGDKLMMTHYCSVGNQPRMSAPAPAGEVKSLNFTFVDATNMAKPTEAHMHSLAMAFQDNDHITELYGIELAQKTLRAKHKLKCPILFVSFLDL